MGDVTLDERLRHYLDERDVETNSGVTLAGVHTAVKVMHDKLVEHEQRCVEDTKKVMERLDAHNFRLLSLESRATKAETHIARVTARDGVQIRSGDWAEAYDPDVTPAGGIHIPQDGWARLEQEFEKFKEQATIAKAKAEGADAALEHLQKNIVTVYLPIGGAVVAVVTWVLTHFLHL